MSEAVTSIDDLKDVLRRIRLEDLRGEKDSEKQSWARELWDEIEKLTHDRDAAIRERDYLEDSLTESETIANETHAELSSLKHSHDAFQQRTLAAEGKLRSHESAFASLRELPSDLPAMIGVIEAIHGNRIRFTKRARESAKDAAVNAQKQHLSTVWRCLWSMATVLHDLFSGEIGEATDDIPTEFQNRSGFALAMTETKLTKESKRLMAMRKDRFLDTDIDITSHVKWGAKESKLFRAYFAYVKEQRLIVVGHCGDHLETAGSRRRG